MNAGYSFRFTGRDDVPVVLEFIHGLANYEQADEEREAAPAVLDTLARATGGGAQ